MLEAYADRWRAGKGQLERTFQLLGKRLEIEVHAWDIGGGPMVFRGLKDGTKDVDLVVMSKTERDAIVTALTSTADRYTIEMSLPEYEGLDAVLLRKQGDVGVDIFVSRIMTKFILSPSMQRRAGTPQRFGNLIVSHCSNEDIFLLKSITKRPDDDQDVLVLAGTGLDGSILRSEALEQQRLTGENWPWMIFNALEEIEDRTGVLLPIRSALVD